MLVILLAFSAYFSMSETAILSVSKLKVRHMIEKKRRGARFLEKIKDDPYKSLTTILVCNNLVNVAASAIATAIALSIFKHNAIAIATGVMTFLILVFGEITPKSYAIKHKETLSLWMARPIWYISVILTPITKIFEILHSKRTEKPLVTEEELKSMINLGEEIGSIKEVERDMIQNIFRFDDIDVKEIMTPRPDMACINVKLKISDMLFLARRKSFSRFPVFEKSRDNIVGMVYIKDAMSYIKNKKFNTPIKKIIRKPYFVPQTKKIDSLFRQFQKRKEQMALVVDEHGVVAGLVTLEDVLEEIVGEIVDESEKIIPSIKKLSENSWQILGKADLGDVNKRLKSRFKEEEDFETFGGFILHRMGKIPKTGDILEVGKFTIEIESVENNRIKETRVRKK